MDQGLDHPPDPGRPSAPDQAQGAGLLPSKAKHTAEFLQATAQRPWQILGLRQWRWSPRSSLRARGFAERAARIERTRARAAESVLRCFVQYCRPQRRQRRTKRLIAVLG